MKTVRWWLVVVALSAAIAYTIAYGRGLSERVGRAEADRTALAQQVRSLGIGTIGHTAQLLVQVKAAKAVGVRDQALAGIGGRILRLRHGRRGKQRRHGQPLERCFE